jgi:Na+-transporting NADH:ubiquinone oxidoreductase subunit NqrC
MSAALIDRILRWRKTWVGERSYCHTHGRLLVTFLGVVNGRSADRAEPECELASLITDANVLGCCAKDLVGGGEAGQRRKDTAGSTLTGEAVTNAYSKWFTLDFNAQLSTETRRGSRTH